MKITEAINLLKQYYKAHNREDVEIEGELRVTGGETIIQGKSYRVGGLEGGLVKVKVGQDGMIKPDEEKDPRSRVGVKFTPEQEKQIRSLSTDEPDPKLGRDKTGDGK